MEMETLEDLLVDELQDIYHAEKQIAKALPKMVKKAKAPELKQAFQKHLDVTEKQIQRLEQVFEAMGQKAKAKPCKAMQGIIEEGKEMMSEDAEPEVMDAALIASCQRVEHYEMAAYGTVAAYAKTLGNNKVAKLLAQTLEEEKMADEKLTQLAESLINISAAAGGEEEEEDGEEEE